MFSIKLPDGIRDMLTDSLGHNLGSRIQKGKATAELTFQFDASCNREYLMEFKRRIGGRTLSTWRGCSDQQDWTEPVLLAPDVGRKKQALADKVDIGDGGMFLRHLSTRKEGPHRIRVEFGPPGSSAVYLALEAVGFEGERVTMQRVEARPNG